MSRFQPSSHGFARIAFTRIAFTPVRHTLCAVSIIGLVALATGFAPPFSRYASTPRTPVGHRPAERHTAADTALDAQFLTELAGAIPPLASRCIAQNWNIKRPDEQTVNKLDQEWWKPDQSLDSIRVWWSMRPEEERLWAACESHFLDRLFQALGTGVKVRGIPASSVEPLLLALTDTTHFTEAQYIASRIQGDTAAGHIARAGAALGDPHRYEQAVTEYYGGAPGFEYGQYRGRAAALLARIYFDEGKLREARAQALVAKRWYRWQEPMLLSDIALQEGDTLGAIRELAFCRVAVFTCGNASSTDTVAQQRLHTLYRAVNHGSLAGVDTVMKRALDDPAMQFPVAIPRWQPADPATGTGTRRVALLQYYTWVHCGNCAPHTTAANLLEKRFGDQIIVLSYHYEPPLVVPGWVGQGEDLNKSLRALLHIGAENRSAPDTSTFCDWWLGGACMVRNVFAGFGPYGGLSLYDQAEPLVERQLTTPTSVSLALQTRMTGNRVAATISAAGLESGPASHPLKVHVVLVEDSLMIPGGNSPVQNRLVRAIAGDSTKGFGTLVPRGKPKVTVQQSFDVAALDAIYHKKAIKNGVLEGDASTWSSLVYHIDRRQLSVVAYVQDQATGEILQAVQSRVTPSFVRR